MHCAELKALHGCKGDGLLDLFWTCLRLPYTVKKKSSVIPDSSCSVRHMHRQSFRSFLDASAIHSFKKSNQN